MPVITRIRNVPKVSAPKYHVARNSNVRLRALTENRCRKTFCCTVNARCRLLSPVPLRKMERHMRFSRTWSARRSMVLATARPSPGSEEHTSELQSLRHLVFRLLLEKKKHMLDVRGDLGQRSLPAHVHFLLTLQ